MAQLTRETVIICHKPLNPSDLKKPVVHFKGFGPFINFKIKICKNFIKLCLQFFEEQFLNGIGTLVWDGDYFSKNTFTFLIPQISKFKIQFFF